MKYQVTYIFQYIICFGSRLLTQQEKDYSIRFQYIICFGSSSIVTGNLEMQYKFQYIICFGSSFYSFLFIN